MGSAKLVHYVCLRILELSGKRNVAEANANERAKRLDTVVKLLDRTLRVIIYGAAALMILREVGVDITPLLTGAGIAGVALGFGAQSLVKDMISGVFLLLEDQIRVGDVIRINGTISGTVERMELRSTAVRDGEGTLHIVPNGEIKYVSNMTYGFSRAVVDVPVPYQADIRKVSEVLHLVIDEIARDDVWSQQFRGKPELAGITALNPNHIIFQIVVPVDSHGRWGMSGEVRRRVVCALDAAGIVMPKAPSA